ncbi:MAG TPA: carboxypeptidase-like regulatory domain-containing protein, partial [Terriglobia bacterium]|nr:carboxypeptidase-like regulatory domain-containing protein [Terriglobia bacterium]
MHPRIHGRTSISIEGVRSGLDLSVRFHFALLTFCLLSLTCAAGFAQSGASGTIAGVVLDPTGAVIQGATVTIDNPVSQYQRTATSNASGEFRFTNVPYNPYHMTVITKGFAEDVRDIDLRSAIPLSLKINLKISAGTQTVTVTTQPNDLIETTPTNHTDIDRAMFSKLPLESQSSSL